MIWVFETDFWDLPFSLSFINSSFTIFKGLKVRWMPWIFLVQILPLTVISLCYNLYYILHQCHKILFEYNVINLETNKYRISIIIDMKMMLPSLGLIYCVLSKSPHPALPKPKSMHDLESVIQSLLKVWSRIQLPPICCVCVLNFQSSLNPKWQRQC